MRIKILTAALFVSIIGCKNESQEGWIDEDRLMIEAAENWVSLGGNYKQQHYSHLNQINSGNVENLGFAWEYDARSTIGRVPRGLEATPFVVDGIMYTSGAWGFVYAINAKTGDEIWRYDPNVDASYNRRTCCDVVNRGVAVWKGKVYVGTLDGYLVCLNAKDGEELWRVDTFTDRTVAYTITGPPQVAKDIVLIGNSGAEFGVRGYITAYDLDSGEEKWRFFIVPGDPNKGFEHEELEMASKTWDPNSIWEAGGGGTVWGQSAYDPELNLVYVGTGNSSPYPIWYRSPSGGDNLFLASILAINPDNGKLKWHYQTTPGEIWDYTATQNIILAELEIKGEKREVLMQAPKNGFFYILDRASGELLSAEKYTKVNWASHVDLKTGRPEKTDQGWYKDEPKLVNPSLPGGHSWNPMSYNPKTGLVYIPEIIYPWIYMADESFAFEKLKWGTGIMYDGTGPPYSEENRKYLLGQKDTVELNKLKAWDPLNHRVVWELIHPVARGNGGVLSTAGDLVFQGTNTGYLKIYEAATGELLKEIEIGTGIMAAPMSYQVEGEQYVAVMAGYGGNELIVGPVDQRAAIHKYQNYGRILAFKLGGGDTPLPPKVEISNVPEPPELELDEQLVIKGESLFFTYCVNCHLAGNSTEYHSQYPNLAKLNPSVHSIFKDIVLKGVFAQNGMASFADVLDESDVNAIQQYLVKQQIGLHIEQEINRKTEYNKK
ncbi:MAG: PQQ-dependent dehydrogenase, methanol/ethanol family [Eudoraea sp.]|uniref:PQQ-dependent dehydrogenase, methanol/ethanol family n=1 Tax=Eudoraea sp. TaxID=1979955 RepID=UPI003266CBC4